LTIHPLHHTVEEMSRLAHALGGAALCLVGGCSLVLDFGESLTASDGGPDASADARPAVVDAGPDPFGANNSFETAAVIEPGTYDGVTIYPIAEHDYFKFTLGATHDVTIDCLFTEVEGDLDMKLYDGAYQKIGNSNGYHDNEQIVKTALAPGDYYIEIFAFQDRFTNVYTLVLTVE
jgi:hypothetical protein